MTHPVLKSREEFLTVLLDQLIALRQNIIDSAINRLSKYNQHKSDSDFFQSSMNLAVYLALREHDLRSLQSKLSEAGLSSLGRGESGALGNINAVIDILSRSIPEHQPIDSKNDGKNLLHLNTVRLFGEKRNDRQEYIMVTLPSSASHDKELIESLLLSGMDCARINCAHDSPSLWQKMIDILAEAKKKTGKSCKIFMDLGGQKIRTGKIKRTGIKKIKAKHNKIKHRSEPEKVLFKFKDEDLEDNETLKYLTLTLPDHLRGKLNQHDEIQFVDTRGKERKFIIIDQGCMFGICENSASISSKTMFYVNKHLSKNEHDTLLNYEFSMIDFHGDEAEITLNLDELLLLAKNEIEGEPAIYDSHGIVSPAKIGCSNHEIFNYIKPGDAVWIDDGKIGTIIEKIDDDGAWLRIKQISPKGARLLADKGLNFPDTSLHLSAITEKDRQDLDFVCKNADIIGMSFVQCIEDVESLTGELEKRNADYIPVVFKIETALAVKNLPDILLGSIGKMDFGVMIARGDLAVELGSVRMAEIQEEILWICEAAHVPVIWATQVLETLIKKGITSRPEITDAAMSVRAECVMLNKGPFITDAVKILSDILSRMEMHQNKKSSLLRKLHW